MSSLPNQAVAGRIRLHQLQAVDQFIPAMMVANIVCSGALMLLLFDVQPVVLPIWFALILLRTNPANG